MPTSYQDRICRVVQYIFDHPEADLSLDALADVAAMSRFHWHRVFHAMTGETCAQAVRRIRAHRAACWLVQTDWPLEQIARRAGYDNAQSFARLFRAQYGMTPLAFRKAGSPHHETLTFRKGPLNMHPFETRDLPQQRLAAVAHKGAYTKIGNAFQQVAVTFHTNGLWPHAQGMVGIYYDSPQDTDEDALRSHAGVRVDGEMTMPETLTEVILPAGTHIVLTYKGPYAGLAAAWEHLYGTILPEKGVTPADQAPFEVYLNDPMDTAPEDLVTEICVPLSKAA